VLQQAYQAEQLSTGPADIEKYVRFDEPPDDIRKQSPNAWAIVGGRKDFKRLSTSAQLLREDGAWLHFSVSVEEIRGELSVIAYSFELVFDQSANPRFVRIDLNQPDHKNDAERGKRCHLHPGHDDIQIAWQEQSPEDVLTFLVTDLRAIKER